MATAMGDGNGNSNRVNDDNGDGNGNRNGNGHDEGNNDKGRVASSCASNVQRYGRGDTLPPPPWCIHQCCIMGVTLLRVFPPFQGGGFLTIHHGFFIVYYLQLLFSLLSNPLFASHIIQALKNPVSPLMLYLIHSSKNPISLLTIYPSSYCTFCQGKLGQGLQ
jgi:hypothetical protein